MRAPTANNTSYRRRGALLISAAGLFLCTGAAAQQGHVPARAAPPLRAPDAPGHQTSGTNEEPAPFPLMAITIDGEIKEYRALVPVGEAFGALDMRGRQDALLLQSIGAIIIDSPSKTPTTPNEQSDGILVLADGQRLSGKLIEENSTAERITWESGLFGRVQLPIEAVVSLLMDPLRENATHKEQSADLLVLTNGDRIEGLITSLGESATIMTDGAEFAVPMQRVAAIHFAHSPRATVGPFVWLRDGSVVRIAGIGRAKQGTAPDGKPIVLALGGDRAGFVEKDAIVAVTDTLDRITPLSSITPTSVQAGKEAIDPDGIKVSEPERMGALHAVGAGNLTLFGPVRCNWTLPEGAAAIIGHVELPKRGWRLSQAAFTIWSDRKPVYELLLDAKNPEADFAVELTGSDLIITLQPRGAGAAQAVVTLRQLALLMRTENPKTSP